MIPETPNQTTNDFEPTQTHEVSFYSNQKSNQQFSSASEGELAKLSEHAINLATTQFTPGDETSVEAQVIELNKLAMYHLNEEKEVGQLNECQFEEHMKTQKNLVNGFKES